MNIQTNASSCLADHGTALESIVDTFDGVIFHANEET